MVTREELESLELVLAQGYLPADLLAKLERLRDDDARELYLKQQSQTLGRLLLSIAASEYHQARPVEAKRFLRMLAYVRKEQDLIPDYLPNGMRDDHDLMRTTCAEFREALTRFKAWHLSRHVPMMFKHQEAQAALHIR